MPKLQTYGVVALFALLACADAAAAPEPLIVHEWGTFTSVQDTAGKTLRGYFINNEPVPFFVHAVNHPGRHFAGVLSEEEAKGRVKGGVPRQHPDLIMRLETPVLYFYPPAGAKLPLTLDVKASMRGGWLTEYFPKAESNITDQDVALDKPLKRDFTGTLAWQALQVGAAGTPPETTDKVWLAPRQTKSALVQVGTETEKYLFYRGVANLPAPLRVVQTAATQTLSLSGDPAALSAFSAQELPVLDSWLVDVKPDGSLAYRQLPALVDALNPKTIVTAPADFAPADYAPLGKTLLHSAMYEAVVRQGMFADEAKAMLTTWEKSYFAIPGKRVFYVVPRAWVEHYLPLQFSVPVKLERAFIGRIELR